MNGCESYEIKCCILVEYFFRTSIQILLKYQNQTPPLNILLNQPRLHSTNFLKFSSTLTKQKERKLNLFQIHDFKSFNSSCTKKVCNFPTNLTRKKKKTIPFPICQGNFLPFTGLKNNKKKIVFIFERITN